MINMMDGLHPVTVLIGMGTPTSSRESPVPIGHCPTLSLVKKGAASTRSPHGPTSEREQVYGSFHIPMSSPDGAFFFCLLPPLFFLAFVGLEFFKFRFEDS
jgi:hypothetical protein